MTVGDRDLLAFRRGYYDLFVSLFWREPPGGLLSALAPGIAARMRAGREVHRLLGEGWEEIARFLGGVPPERLEEVVSEEYTRLFIGLGNPEVNLYESFYLTGRVYDRPLAAVRQFLRIIGLEKDEKYAEPEDFLAFELEILRTLLGRQAAAPDPDAALHQLDLEATFLKEHLLVWAPTAAQDLAAARGAAFYRGVARLLEGFLEVEREVVGDRGPAEIKSLAVAREAFARVPMWRGPLFEDSIPPVEEGEPGGTS